MIIVEGLDNTGKTTLIHKLLEWFPELKLEPKNVSTQGPKSREQLVEYMDKYLALPKRRTHNLIFDRFPVFSEAVYGPIIRGHMVFNEPDEWQKYMGRLSWHHPLVIHCRIPLHKVAQTFYNREQMEGVSKNLVSLDERYCQVMSQTHNVWLVKVIEYDWTCHTDESIRKAVEGYLETSK